LTDDDAGRVKLDLYNVVIWHLLADDRLGRTQQEMLARLRRDFAIADDEAPIEGQAIAEFESLRGMRTATLPRQQIAIPVKFHEYGILSAKAGLLGRNADEGSLYLTNKRLIFDGRKRFEIPLTHIDDVEVDPDANTLALKVAQPHRPLTLRVDQPFYTAALIDLATNIDERPRSFA
jgi:hypothetical protein